MDAKAIKRCVGSLYLNGELEKCCSADTKKALLMNKYSAQEADAEIENAKSYYNAIKAVYDAGKISKISL